MYAVGRLGSYITQGVYTVAGPFHPFGGAVDIIVVEQQDGSFKSSPWYVRFGKFQGVLKSKEKVVDISVDGVQADFNMYLDHRGQAYFLREVECEEGDSLFYPSSSGEETDGQVSDRMPLKTKSFNYDSHPPSSVTRIDVSNGKIVTRTSSRRFLGLVFGRKSMKDNSFGEEEDGSGVVRADSLERAEIAADLLEVRWSTNLDVSKHRKESSLDQDVVNEEIRNRQKKIDTSSRFGRQKLGSPNEDLGVEMSCLNDGLGENYVINSQTIMEIDELVVMNADHDKISETESPVLDSAEIDANPCKNLDEELDFEKNNGVSEGESEAELISEVYSVQKASLLEAIEAPDIPKLLVDRKDDNSFSDGQIPVSVEIYSNSFENSIMTKTYCQTVTVDPINILAKSVETSDCFTISDLKKSLYGDLGGGTSYGDFQENVNIVTAEGVVVSPSEGSEEEQLLFGEFDDFSYREGNCTESYSSSHLVEEYPTLVKSQNDVDDVRERSRIVSSSISIPKRNRVDHEDIGRMAESLPNMWPPINGVVLEDFQHPLGHSLDSNFEALTHNALEEDVSSCIKSDADKEEEVFGAKSNVKDAQMTEELNNVPSSITNGDPSKLINPSNGSWRVWPFSFRRSKSMNNSQQIQNSTRSLEAENNLRSPISTDGEKDALKPKGKKKKKVRVLTPTPEQLASLNLKEGKNTVTFTFSTSMLGPQKVDAKIYLWKWDTRIVISDVDGTITKSDVLGQFMPMVGMDWSQTGVAHLFSAIKENGYQLLFLSARAISQAYHTRQFLFNLKQDGKALPDGPVVISPDGLFPSLFREVIRRAPHEFKIACLEDIRALFPSDRSPFYAGFGNRDTDEISYLKVGIPKGKIFIINPKGEVVVNRRVDGKSYHSLKALVHDMFPPMSSCEQEDFNSWNYWKLPPPAIDL